jgi:SNF2 family DNA or RNA helicase
MARITETCPTCGKIASEDNRAAFGNLLIITLKCGHFLTRDKSDLVDFSGIKSISGKSLYPFQAKTCEFAVENNFRVGIFHEMGLGKTPISIALLVAYSKKLTPCLIICKSGLKTQIARELIDWSGGKLIPQVITNPREPIIGLPVTIVSYDMLRNMGDTLKEFPFTSMILDEVQQIKNPESKRTLAVKAIIRGSNDRKPIQHIIPLSGTPFKNNGAEYFTILNILDPVRFPSYSQFLYRWCDYSSGSGGYMKVNGIRRSRLKEFQEYVSDLVIRYERIDVMPDLPVITRNLRVYDIEEEEVKKAYEKKTEEFIEAFDSYEEKNSTEGMTNLLAIMSRLRHLTGIAKINPTVEFVEDFLLSTERKIVVFVHHKDVGKLFVARINESLKAAGLHESLEITAEMDSVQRDNTVESFRSNPAARVMVASTLASGEGLNMQFCSDCILLEREWNPANEEQAEGRFIRIGQTALAVTATYPTAQNTIDEYFAEIVEKKRAIFNSMMNGSQVTWDQSSLIRELMSVVASKGRNNLWSI